MVFIIVTSDAADDLDFAVSGGLSHWLAMFAPFALIGDLAESSR